MRFFLPFFAVGAMAASLAPAVSEHMNDFSKRDLQTISNAFANISNAQDLLQTAVNQFNRTNATSILALNTASLNVLAAVNASIADVEPTSAIDYQDSLKLGTIIGNFYVSVNKTITSIINMKPTFVATGIGSLTYASLVQTRDVSVIFSKIVQSKTPKNEASISAALAAPIAASLQQGVDAYADQASPAQISSASAAYAAATATSVGMAASMPTAASGYGMAAIAALAVAAAL